MYKCKTYNAMQISHKSGERGKTTWEKPPSKKRDMYKSEKEREEDPRRGNQPPQKREERSQETPRSATSRTPKRSRK